MFSNYTHSSATRMTKWRVRVPFPFPKSLSTNFRAAPQCIRLFLIHIHRPTLYVSIDLSLPLRSPERASQARMSMGSFRVTSRDVNPAGF